MSILKDVSTQLNEKNLLLSTAESCTGGWLAKTITDLAGSSTIFDRGFVTYSNEAKQEMLGVAEKTLENFGAVSEQVVLEMAEGVLKNSAANIAISISGVAGPGGGTDDKPVGMVCFGWLISGENPQAETIYFDGDRDSVRKQSVEYALEILLRVIAKS